MKSIRCHVQNGLAFICCLFMMSGFTAQGQAYDVKEFNISILGASTLHDWKVSTNEIIEYPQSIDLGEDLSLSDFGFKVAVDGMDGGRGPSMNKKIKKALKAATYPHVSFTQTEAIHLASKDDGNTVVNATGSLNIAGVEKVVTIELTATTQENQLVFTGKYPMKMSDFDIEPPSAMFGQIETKDDITIEFELIYQTK